MSALDTVTLAELDCMIAHCRAQYAGCRAEQDFDGAADWLVKGFYLLKFREERFPDG
ncbi:MAG: hypothetical protein AAFR68_16610 [Pseudomonadota bacterium]